jgi:hypothetical protein
MLFLHLQELSIALCTELINLDTIKPCSIELHKFAGINLVSDFWQYA